MKKVLKSLFCIIAVIALLACALPVSAEYLGYGVLDMKTEIILNTAEDYGSFWFVAPESCVYKFYSTGDYDTVGYIVDSDSEYITSGDDSAEDANFVIYCYLEVGKTYGFIADFYDDTETGSFKVEVTKTDIKSVKLNDITVYDGINGYDIEEYDPETDEFYYAYTHYYYSPSFSVTLKDGTVLQSDQYGTIQYDGEEIYCYCDDAQSAETPWTIGTHLATGEIFGIIGTFNVTIEENPIQSIEFNDITLYEGWDCIIIDEDWNDILGVEITEPITIYYYAPVYTVTLNDGTVLHSNELGYVEYNGVLFGYDDLLDDQDIENQWTVGEHSATAIMFGEEYTFNVTVLPNPAQSVEFEDVTLLKDWDYITDYEYNPITDDYDLEWQYYVYTPSYTITLNDGTILQSDENGYVKFNNKTYGILGFDDGQSYETPWTEAGAYPVAVKLFGEKYTFNVILEEMESVSGDVNRDGHINNRDYALLMQYINKWDVKIDKGAADVNDDNVINNRDYALLMQYINKWDVVLK